MKQLANSNRPMRWPAISSGFDSPDSSWQESHAAAVTEFNTSWTTARITRSWIFASGTPVFDNKETVKPGFACYFCIPFGGMLVQVAWLTIEDLHKVCKELPAWLAPGGTLGSQIAKTWLSVCKKLGLDSLVDAKAMLKKVADGAALYKTKWKPLVGEYVLTGATMIPDSPEEESISSDAVRFFVKIVRLVALLIASPQGAHLVMTLVGSKVAQKTLIKKDVLGAAAEREGLAFIGSYYSVPVVLDSISFHYSTGDSFYCFFSAVAGLNLFQEAEAKAKGNALGKCSVAVASKLSFAPAFVVFAHELCHLHWGRVGLLGDSTIAPAVSLLAKAKTDSPMLAEYGDLWPLMQEYAGGHCANLRKSLSPMSQNAADVVFDANAAVWFGVVHALKETTFSKSLSLLFTSDTIAANAIVKLLSTKLIEEIHVAIVKAYSSGGNKVPKNLPKATDIADAIHSMLQEIYVTSAGPEWKFSENWIRKPYGLPNRVGHRGYISKPSASGAALPKSKCDGGPTGGGFATITAVTPTSMSQFFGC